MKRYDAQRLSDTGLGQLAQSPVGQAGHRTDGAHRFASTRYVSLVLAAYVGETVTVRYDPRDAAELRVYHHDQYLCRANAPELAADAVTLKQLQDARNAQRKALKQQLRERRSLADALPADHRYLAQTVAPVAPGQAPLAPAGPAGGPTPDPLPRHRLRTYASD